MPRSRPTSNPLSYHKPTGQYYVTRGGRRVYLGADLAAALVWFHRLQLGMTCPVEKAVHFSPITLKELSNRFLTTQRANWRNPTETMKGYLGWLGRFLKDHPRLSAQDFTVEMFANWKISLKERRYSPQSINHYLSAVRALFRFAEDTEWLEKAPRLNRVKNESSIGIPSNDKPIYSSDEISTLLRHADVQMKAMILLGLNCGFGPKDIQDLTWAHIAEGRVTLPRSKTGICQTYRLWPETQNQMDAIFTTRKGLRLLGHPEVTADPERNHE